VESHVGLFVPTGSTSKLEFKLQLAINTDMEAG